MGNESSKKKYGPSISKETKESIYKMLETACPNFKEITANTLQKAWFGKISEGLQQKFIAYLFRESKAVTLAEFETFFYKMVDAGRDEQAETLAGFVTTSGTTLQAYVSDLMESYMMLLNAGCPEACSSWRCDELTQKADINAISYYVTKDSKYRHDGTVSVNELESWLGQASLVREVQESVIRAAWGVAAQLRPRLPTATATSALLSAPMAVVLAHLTRQDARNWRLLYSSDSDPHSWQILQSRLWREGPTVLLVQDGAGPLLGGYASNSWRLVPTFYGDENCFLFRLRPELRICFPTGYNQNFQYINSGASTLPNGLGMGGQLNYFGLFLSSEFGPGSVSKTCTTFRDYVPLASGGEFTFSQLEVWAVGEPEPEEEGVRQFPGGPLAMQRDPGAVAILELAGKGGHAKAAGELPDALE